MSRAETFARRPRLEGRRTAGNRAQVAFYPGELQDVQRISRRLFGRSLATQEYAGLTGAPGGAEVTVGTFDGGLYVEITEPVANDYRGVWLVHPVRSQVIIVNDAFHIRRREMRRRGLGLCVFRRQLHYAKLLDIKRIETTAGRAADENGYYTWPRFGFNGPLPDQIQAVLPPGLRHARTVLDLLEHEMGRRWWKEHGITVEVTFDLTAGSRCWKAFQRYLRHRLGHEFSEPLMDGRAVDLHGMAGPTVRGG